MIALLPGCDSQRPSISKGEMGVESIPNDVWQPITWNLDAYVQDHPDRPIVAHIWARWDTTGMIPRTVLRSTEVSEAFTTAGFLCLDGDVTESDPLLLGVIKQLGRDAPPVTAIYEPSTQYWRVCPEVFTADAAVQWATR